MSLLAQLTAALAGGSVRIVDLTAPLHSDTPILQLPEIFGQTARFQLEEISRYDDRGPAWYWNNFHTGEHTGTHFDAPNHWVTGQDQHDVASVPLERLIRPAAVIDVTDRVADDHDFLLTKADVEAWQDEHGPLPEGGWLILRTGWSSRNHDQAEFLNADEFGPHTPGIDVECARWLAEEAPIIGLGVETVGTDAGAAGGFDPMYPCHTLLLGAGKYGLAQLQNVDQLPATGALVITSPLPIVTGSGSPPRVLALVED
ncbi:cyclase family protein [Aestuariimicrobium ganziense]|uniref:cyclase family protein n=1 Tax=Aestuariimicrobium ganziense TaxID=2773677 RepID=UPI0019429662|nr:cyclase family protein [Aestuariimicrobium ganziense]